MAYELWKKKKEIEAHVASYVFVTRIKKKLWGSF